MEKAKYELPITHTSSISGAMKVKRKSQRFLFKEGQLFRRGFNQAPLKYLASNEATKSLKEVHVEVCYEQQGASRPFK